MTARRVRCSVGECPVVVPAGKPSGRCHYHDRSPRPGGLGPELDAVRLRLDAFREGVRLSAEIERSQRVGLVRPTRAVRDIARES